MTKERPPEDSAKYDYVQHPLELGPASASFAYRRMMSMVLLGQESGFAEFVQLYEGIDLSSLHVVDMWRRDLLVAEVIMPTRRAIASTIEDSASVSTLQMKYFSKASADKQYAVTYGSSMYDEQVAGRTAQQVFDAHLEQWRSILESRPSIPHEEAPPKPSGVVIDLAEWRSRHPNE
jgi:hypothetical protein